MGFYIETGKACGKAQYIIDNFNAEVVSFREAEQTLEDGKGVVCVVANGKHFQNFKYGFG